MKTRNTFTRALTTFAVAIALVIAGCDSQGLAPEKSPALSDPQASSQAQKASDQSSEPIPGQYIVVFKDDVDNVPEHAQSMIDAHGGKKLYVYKNALKGFAVGNLPAAAVQALQNDPRVEYVEQDGTVHAVGSQYNPPWGLDRIDQRDLPLDDTYEYDADGTGVNVYVIDTGIRISHNDFEGRASYGYDFVEGDSNAEDCHGHGTHVAGTAGGSTYGVAKDANLVAVRVLDCSGYGSYSDVIAGVDWVSQNATHPAVANMSLAGPASSALDDAVQRSINDYNVQYSIAAGNDGVDAGTRSPARVEEAMTIGATDRDDARANFDNGGSSNYGSVIDWFASGKDILSAGIGSDTDTDRKGGTSMAAPHTAGVAALYLENNEFATAQEVRDTLYSATTKSIVSDAQSANDHLLYNFSPENDAPTASFEYTTSGQSASFTDQSYDSDGSIASWYWRFGDGETSTEQNPTHYYSSNGNYTVTLTVTDDEGASSSASRHIYVSSDDDCDPDEEQCEPTQK